MDNRMTALETRFDTILPTLATKEDLKNLEVKLTTTLNEDIKKVEHAIHTEVSAIRKEMITNNWRMTFWMTTVVGMLFTIGRFMPN